MIPWSFNASVIILVNLQIYFSPSHPAHHHLCSSNCHFLFLRSFFFYVGNLLRLLVNLLFSTTWNSVIWDCLLNSYQVKVANFEQTIKLYYWRIPVEEGTCKRVKNVTVCLHIFFGIFKILFHQKIVFLSFSPLFWWSMKFLQQNIYLSKTGIGDKKLSVKLWAIFFILVTAELFKCWNSQ